MAGLPDFYDGVARRFELNSVQEYLAQGADRDSINTNIKALTAFVTYLEDFEIALLRYKKAIQSNGDLVFMSATFANNVTEHIDDQFNTFYDDLFSEIRQASSDANYLISELRRGLDQLNRGFDE